MACPGSIGVAGRVPGLDGTEASPGSNGRVALMFGSGSRLQGDCRREDRDRDCLREDFDCLED